MHDEDPRVPVQAPFEVPCRLMKLESEGVQPSSGSLPAKIKRCWLGGVPPTSQILAVTVSMEPLSSPSTVILCGRRRHGLTPRTARLGRRTECTADADESVSTSCAKPPA